MKLIDILIESMANGNAFKAFVNAAVLKKEIQANEELNFEKKYKIYSRLTGYIGSVNKSTLDKMINNGDVFESDGQYYCYSDSKIRKKYNIS
jgi:hypothetical protein